MTFRDDAFDSDDVGAEVGTGPTGGGRELGPDIVVLKQFGAEAAVLLLLPDILVLVVTRPCPPTVFAE